MAGNMDSLTETLTCPVCFEDFEESGNHVPRFLPCSHSFCHSCIGQLIRGTRLECPTCRMRHEVRNKEKSFPQNKYILTMVKRNIKLEEEERDESGKCSNHGDKEILFCRQDGCQKLICPLCLTDGHLGHKVVSIKVETKDALTKLLQNIDIANEKLKLKMTKIEGISEDVLRKTETNLMKVKNEKEKMIQDLEKKKEEMIKQYNRIIKQTEDEKHKLSEGSDNELTAMRDIVESINSIKQSIEEEESTYENVQEKLETVQDITQNAEHFPLVKKYEYSEYIPGQEYLPGKLVKKEKFVSPVRELRGQVRQNINTGLSTQHWPAMTCLSDGTVVVCGTENGQQKLKRFSLETGRELGSANVKDLSGITEVEQGGKSTLAVSGRSATKIELCNKEDLNMIIHTYSVAPHKPGLLCRVSPSVLVYEDTSHYPRQLHWLDCNETKPRLLGITADTNFSIVRDICTAEWGKEKLLMVITYDPNEFIRAYNSTTGQLKWSVPMKTQGGTFQATGVAVDDNGRLFVADTTNECIQMFSASDGQYFRCLMKRGDQGLSWPNRLRWSETTSSLVVAHHDGAKYFISDIH